VTHEDVHRDTVEYWRSVTADDRPIDGRHPAPKQHVMAKYFSALRPAPGQRVLDIGIGFGRFVPVYQSHGLEIHGVDVDPLMIEALRTGFPDRTIAVRPDPAEALSFPDAMFDLIVCWGVFDELDQGPALAEMARVLKIGGQLLVTGKNSRYHAGDENAIAAEVGARAKNHRNFFTDLATMDFGRFGLRVEALTTFERRGDFAAERPAAMTDLHAPFYEYVFAARKTHAAEVDRHSAPAISRSVSLTFEAITGSR
jgi:SAM-dependent methyltransferase